MTIVRALDLDTLHLAKGGHDAPDDGTPGEMCLMEAVSWMAGEDWSDSPDCVCTVLAAFGRRLNDLLPDDRRQELRQYMIPMLGTAGDGLAERRRWMAADWAVRTATPMWFDSAGHPEKAAQLRALDTIDSRAMYDAVAWPLLRQMRTELRALRDEKLREFRSRAAAAAVAAADADAAAAAVAASDALTLTLTLTLPLSLPLTLTLPAVADADAAAVAAAAADADADAAAAADAAAVADAAAAADADAAAAADADADAVAKHTAWDETYRSTYDRVYAATRARIDAQFGTTITAVQSSAIDLFGRLIRP